MDSSNTRTSRRFINSLGKGFQILSAFTAERPELSANDLAQHTGLDRTTIHRFLTTLVQIGVLRQNPQSRKYQLGLRLLEYAYNLLDAQEFRRIALSHLVALEIEPQKVLTIGIRDGVEVVLVERIWGPQSHVSVGIGIGRALGTGMRFPVYASTIGRCLLAHLPQEEREEVLSQLEFAAYTPYTLTSRELLMERLEEIRARGYDASGQELWMGHLNLAVPLRGAGGVAVAAIHIGATTADTTLEELVDQWAPKLIAVGERISQALGYRPQLATSGVVVR